MYPNNTFTNFKNINEGNGEDSHKNIITVNEENN